MEKKLSLMMTALIALLLTSCGAKKEIAYFKNIDDCPEVLDSIYADYAVRIKPADELLITVWSEVAEATQLYNLPQVAYAEAGDVEMTANRKILSYVVDKDGYILFPVVGKIKVEGMTTAEVADLLTERISNDVRDPLVRVQMANFRVNVMGEVNSPRTVTVKTERFSVLDALSAAGDLTVYGRRDNVLLIREADGKRSYHRLDLTKADLLTSPYFYLQQNDVVYVEPDAVRRSNAEYNQNNSFKVQIISATISAVSVIASLVIALVINKK